VEAHRAELRVRLRTVKGGQIFLNRGETSIVILVRGEAGRHE